MIADLALALVLAWWSVTAVAVVFVRRLLRNPQALMAKMMQQQQRKRATQTPPRDLAVSFETRPRA